VDIGRGDARDSEPKSGIGKAALAMTACTWAVVAGTLCYWGNSGWRAAGLASVAALGGFASWWIYHLTTRRNDGLLIPLVTVLPQLAPMTTQNDLVRTVITSLILVALTFIFAMCTRALSGTLDGRLPHRPGGRIR
jgi:hypothetical protein